MSLIAATVVALPWLQGFFAPSATSDSGSYDCGREDADNMTLTADLAPAPGAERIVISYNHGATVYGRDGKAIATAPGFACEGSADELVAMAVGDAAIGVPLLALAQTSGGHNESRTMLRLYRVAANGTLAPVFAAEVETNRRDPDDNTVLTRTGIVTVVPGGLVYRSPAGDLSLWVYDAGRYVQSLTTRPAS